MEFNSNRDKDDKLYPTVCLSINDNIYEIRFYDYDISDTSIIETDYWAIGYASSEARCLLECDVNIPKIFDVISKHFAGKVNDYINELSYKY